MIGGFLPAALCAVDRHFGTPLPDTARKQLQGTIDVIGSTGGLAIGVPPMVSPLLSTPVPMRRYDLRKAELERIRNEVHAVHLLIQRPYKVEFDLQPAPKAMQRLQVSVLNPDGSAAQDKQARCQTNIQP